MGPGVSHCPESRRKVTSSAVPVTFGYTERINPIFIRPFFAGKPAPATATQRALRPIATAQKSPARHRAGRGWVTRKPPQATFMVLSLIHI